MSHGVNSVHACPRCGLESQCTIEDGRCDAAGLCDRCLVDREYERLERGFNYD